jgi:hypothetical protein
MEYLSHGSERQWGIWAEGSSKSAGTGQLGSRAVGKWDSGGMGAAGIVRQWGSEAVGSEAVGSEQ